MSKNKINLEARLFLRDISEEQKKEIASELKLDLDKKQQDLLYMSAILVSTGTNKNGATFLASELVNARDSIINKPLDYEHENDKIVGHIISSMFLDHSGEKIDDFALYSKLNSAKEANPQDYKQVVASIDEYELDIGIICVVYKNRFRDLATEIARGDWKVSMECYYKDFDLKIGDLIIPKEQAEKACTELQLNDLVKLVVSGQSLGNHKVSRVLRGIHFSGAGIVKHPANVRSVVLESADKKHRKEIQISEEVESYMAASEGYREAASSETSIEVKVGENINFTHTEENTKDIFQKQFSAPRYLILNNKTGNLAGSEEKNEEFSDKAAAERYAARLTAVLDQPHSIVEFHDSFSSDPISSDEDGFRVITATPEGEVVKQVEVGSFVGEAGRGGRFGPDDNTAGLCISYKKYYYQYDGTENPGELRAVGWCKQFGKPCPVLGADATAPECLRHRYARLIRDDLIHFNATRPEIFNPKSTKGPDEIEVLRSEDLPTPPDNPRDYQTSLDKIDVTKPVELTAEGLQEYPKKVNEAEVNIRNSDEVSDLPAVIEDKEDIKEFTSVNSDLDQRLPSEIAEFNNQVRSFAEELLGESRNYGIPRLKLFPLDSKAAVMAAISRYGAVKADITPEEKSALFVKIVKAAKIFGLDVNKFIDRVKNN